MRWDLDAGAGRNTLGSDGSGSFLGILGILNAAIGASEAVRDLRAYHRLTVARVGTQRRGF